VILECRPAKSSVYAPLITGYAKKVFYLAVRYLPRN
jgi:hypothetical protein